MPMFTNRGVTMSAPCTRGVHERELAERVDRGPRHHRQIRELDAVLLLESVLRRGAQTNETLDVDLDHRPGAGGLVDGGEHVRGDRRADVRHRLDVSPVPAGAEAGACVTAGAVVAGTTTPNAAAAGAAPPAAASTSVFVIRPPSPIVLLSTVQFFRIRPNLLPEKRPSTSPARSRARMRWRPRAMTASATSKPKASLTRAR